MAAPHPADPIPYARGMDPDGETSRLLRRVADGEAGAEPQLFARIYGELHALARIHMERQSAAHTLQPTALVHEAWLRLIGREPSEFNDREHFLSFASRAMRSVLVDHARRRTRDKRGGGHGRVPLDVVLDALQEERVEVLELHDALERLGAQEPDLERVVELRFFGGLTMEEAARTMEVSLSTAERSWRLARMWLKSALAPGSPGAGEA